MLHGPLKCLFLYQPFLLQNLMWMAWMLMGLVIMFFKLISWGYKVSTACTANFILTFSHNNITECEYCKLIGQNTDEEANVALVHHRLLRASPTQPAFAFKLESLEFYHQLCRCQGSLSIQAFIKVICAIHNVCYILNSNAQAMVLIHLQITYTNQL